MHDQKWNVFGGTYGGIESKLLHDTLLHNDIEVRGKNILVIGSINPWVESIFLGLGANQTVTLEYNKIVSAHPQVTNCGNTLTTRIQYCLKIYNAVEIVCCCIIIHDYSFE